MRTSDLPPPCSSTSARTSSQAQRPTKTLTSRSSDQPFVDLDRADGARAPQPVGELREHAIGRRPRLAPEAILGDVARDEQQRAPRLGERRPRAAAGLRRDRRHRDFRRRQHAADAAADPRERLDEVQIGDRRAVPELAAAAASRRRSAARRRCSSRPSPRGRCTPLAEQDVRRPVMLPRRGDADAGERRARRRSPATGSSAAGTRTGARRCGTPTGTPRCPRRRR